MSEFQKESLSLEETNRVRISLGLKPLVDDSASTSRDGAAPDDAPKDKDEIAEDNYRKRRDQEAKAKEEDEIRQRIARAQNKRQLKRQLRGPTLGDEEPSTSTSGPSDSKSTIKWLKQAQKKAKEHAERRAKELEEQEAAATYSEADLAGLRVAHDVDDFDLQEGDEGRILTLRDSRILDGDEDELMDASLEQKELDRRNEERKKGPKQYTGIDEEDDMTSMALGKKKGVLSKYDADIPERQRDRAMMGDSDGGFRLGGSTETSAERKEKKQRELEEEARRANRSLLNLDYSKNQEVSDYLAPGDVGFKKAKGKKKKRPAATKMKLGDDDDEEEQKPLDNEDTEMKPVIHARRRAEDRDNLIDDDELAASLAKARRAKAKKAISKMTPEEIAKNLAAQKAAEEAAENGGVDGAGDSVMATGASSSSSSNLPEATPGMTFDETSEFIRNIGNRQATPVERRSRQVSVKREPSETATTSNVVDADSLLASSTAPIKQEPGDDDEMLDGAQDVEDEAGFPVSPAPPRDAASGSPDVALGTSAEQLVSNGLAGTLGILRSQGLLESMTPEQRRREAEQRSYDAWKAKRQAEEALREHERQMSKLQGSAKDQATREYENKMRELDEARRAEERFRDYKPDVEIKYHDEHGRVLNNHEAWKLLSHTFHGKMPGRAKQEKEKRRIEEERKKERMAAGEAQDMSKAFRERAAREGQAHMVLSVGAKGNAPQEFADGIGPNMVQHHANRRAAAAAGAGSSSGAGGRAGEASSSKGKASTVLKPPHVGGGMSSLTPSNGRATPSATAGMRSLRPPGFTVVESGGSQSPAAAAIASGSSSFAPLPPASRDEASPAPSTAPRMKPGFQPVAAAAAPAQPSSASGSAPAAAPSNGVGGGGFKISLGTKRKADEQGGRQ